MRIEKIIKRDDGSKVRIIATLRDSYHGLLYDITVHTCEPKKRSWYGTFSTDSFSYRKLSTQEREAYIESKNLEHVTKEEIYQAKLELWESIKPRLEP